jgi:LmbE family N-acetylglucosaminyl deacetylase
MNRVKETVRRLAAGSAAAALRRRSAPLPAIDGVLLVVAPHPDDETLGCGGLIARQAAAGRRVHVLFVTDGEASHQGHPTLEPSVLARQRQEEAIAALAELGVASPRSAATFLGAPDGALGRLADDDRAALIDVLRKWIRADRPEVVCAPYHGGGSSEHDAVTEMVRAALAGESTAQLLEYPVWAWWNALRLGGQVRKASANLRLDLGAWREAKLRALRCHRSQTEPMPPWTEPVLPAAIVCPCTGPTEFYFRSAPASGRGERSP